MPARAGRASLLGGGEGRLDLAAGAAAAGLLRWASRDDGGLAFRTNRAMPALTAHLARLGQWLRENF
jgi:hypothetical protein